MQLLRQILVEHCLRICHAPPATPVARVTVLEHHGPIESSVEVLREAPGIPKGDDLVPKATVRHEAEILDRARVVAASSSWGRSHNSWKASDDDCDDDLRAVHGGVGVDFGGCW